MPSAMWANLDLDDPPIRIHPIFPAVGGCKAKEPFSSGRFGKHRVAPWSLNRARFLSEGFKR
jgi:hypothetical protein